MHIQSQNPVSVEDDGVFFAGGGRSQVVRDWWDLGSRAGKALQFEALYPIGAILLRWEGFQV